MGDYMQKAPRKKLGSLLVDAGIITQEQLDEVLAVQKETGKKLGELLLEKGLISNDDIIQVLEFQLGIPHVNLDRCEIDPQIVKKIPENLAKRHNVIPIKIENNKLVVAMSDPLDLFAIDDIKLYTSMDIITNIASPDDIRKTLSKMYSEQEAIRAAEQFKKEVVPDTPENNEEDKKLEEVVNSAPIVKLVNNIFDQGVKARASDIHIEPQEKYLKIRYRVDGQLQEVIRHDIGLQPGVITRIKIMGGMDIAEKRIPQDGRASITSDGGDYDLRLSILPTIYGEKAVIRITSKSSFVKDKLQLGFYTDDLEKFSGILKNPHGIVLVTGPTGSGKSTTLYAAVKDLNNSDVNIITVEDPVEAKIEGVNQVQVNKKAGMTFAAALRSILRQDPDIIMVGEIRDQETASIAIAAAITGHLVLSTIHTNDAPSTISRLVDMGIEPFLIGSSIVGILAQRLVKRVCPYCADEYIPSQEELRILGQDIHSKIKLVRGTGCTYCGNTGFRGRLGVYEILTISPRLRQIINKGGTADEIRKVAIEEGLQTLKMNCSRLVIEGKTTISEMLRVAYANE